MLIRRLHQSRTQVEDTTVKIMRAGLATLPREYLRRENIARKFGQLLKLKTFRQKKKRYRKYGKTYFAVNIFVQVLLVVS